MRGAFKVFPFASFAVLFLSMGSASEPGARNPPPSPRTDLYGDPLPPGAVARLGTMALRQPNMGNPVSSFSPDGKLLAVGGDAGTVKVWDTGTGKLLWQTEQNDLSYHFPVFTPNGRWLVVCDWQSVRLLGPMTGKEGKRLSSESARKSPPSYSHLLACSPDSRWLATFAREEKRNFVYVWDLELGRLVHRIVDDFKGVSQAAFAPDGRSLIAFDWDNRIVRWDLTSGRIQKTVELTIPQVRNIRISHDGGILAIVPANQDPVQLFDTETGKVRVTLQGDFARSRDGLAFTPDGKSLATNWHEDWANDGWICLWDAESGKQKRRFRVPHHGVSDLRFAPDGRTLLVGTWGPQVQLWDCVTGEQLLKRPGHEREVRSVAFTPDGCKLVSAGSDGIRVWDVARSQSRLAWRGHERGTNAVAALPDGASVLTSGWDGSLRIWDLASGQERRQIVVHNVPGGGMPPKYYFNGLRLAADGRTALSISQGDQDESLLQSWELSTGKELLRRSNHFGSLRETCSADLKLCLGFATQHGELAFIPPGQAVVEEIATGREILRVQQPDYAHCLVFSQDAHTFITSTSHHTRQAEGGDLEHNHALHVWEMTTGRERLTIHPAETTGSEHHISRLAMSPDGRTLVAARENNSILLWDLATGRELLRLGPADAWVTSLAFSPDQKLLATSHVDSTILLWDISSATQGRLPTNQATPQELESWWSDLAGEDARKAHTAIWRLAAIPEQATKFLRDRLHPAEATPQDKVRQWLIDLDADQFQRRETATKELAALEELAEPALEAALKERPTLEKRRRIENLLNAPRIVRSPEKLRHLRAIEALERCATKEADAILAKLAEGAPASRVTEAAKSAVEWRRSGRPQE